MRRTSLVLLILLLLPFAVLGAKKQTAAKRPFVWVLDAGHGGHDVGTKGNYCYEKDINLRIVKELQKLLNKHKPGIKVILTRSNDTYLTLQRRCQIANNARADLFVSVHVNHADNKPLLHGTETFIGNPRSVKSSVTRGILNRNHDRSELVGRLIQRNYRLAGRVTERGVKPSNYYVTLHCNMPAVLTEVGFMSNLSEQNYMKTDQGMRELATCIYNALAEYHATIQQQSQRSTLSRLRATGDRDSGLKLSLLPVGRKAEPAPTPVTPLASQPQPESEVVRQVVQVSSQQINEQMIDENPAVAYLDASLNGVEEPAPVSPMEKTDDASMPDGRLTAPDEPSVQADQQPVPQPAAPAPVTRPMPVFSIQLVAVSAPLAPNDPRLKGLSPVTFVKAGNVYKGLYGGTTSYKQAQHSLSALRTKFPDAFIVAYLGDKPISTAEALKY